MDGYSVQEAASVLGVAEGRVWELLARGVISGTPDGDSMRVFLKAQAGPIATAGAREEPARTNGNGGSHAQSGEASAFRELLTEFRNLTERYGQALLALGEARGEVAGLRSRVDLLEARLDVRVAAPRDAATIAWEAPAREAPAPQAPTPAVDTSAPRARAAAPRTSRPRKARSTRDAVAGFAEALARAQDPGVADVADVRVNQEAVEAPAAPDAPAAPEVEDAGSEPVALESTAVDEAAQLPPVEVEASPAHGAVVVEPDWFADGDFAWLEAAEIEAQGQADSVAVEPAIESEPEPIKPEPIKPEPRVEATPEAVVEPESEPQPEPVAVPPAPEALAELEPEPIPPEPVAEAEPEPAPLPEPIQPEPVPTPEAEPEAAPPPEPIQPEPVPTPEAEPVPTPQPAPAFEPWRQAKPAVEAVSPQADATPAPEPLPTATATAVDEVTTVVEEEVMWLGGETTQSSPSTEPIRAERESWPAVDRGEPAPRPTVEPVRPPLAMTEDELARLALDEGWDEAEVAAIRAMITPPRPSAAHLPGGSELDEAMAALEAVPIQPDPFRGSGAARQWTKPAVDDDTPRARDEWAFEAETAVPPTTPTVPPATPSQAAPPRRQAPDLGWLRRRQGPAASAYRRLRRLLPG